MKLLLFVHTFNILSRKSHKVKLLYRLRMYLNTESLNMVYKAIIQSLIDYCITVWGNTSTSILHCVQRLQNRAARAVLGNFDFKASVTSMISQLGWMNVKQRYHYFLGILVYKCLQNMAPSYLCEKFSFVKDRLCMEYQTRSCTQDLLDIPRPNVEIFKRSLNYAGSVFWNSLPSSLRSIGDLSLFKEKLKLHVLTSLS